MTRILIVEDDIAFCTMLKTFLEKKDFEVSTAYTANEALNLLSTRGFEVVISDVRLPDKEGLEILREVQNREKVSPVIMMTSYAEISMAVNAMKEGAFDYISKPFNPEVILDAIKKAMNTVPQPKSRPAPAAKNGS